jgi:hypothetical protein
MKKIIILSALTVSLGGAAQAQVFSYNNADLLIGFRSSSASKDLVVDIGPESTYAAAGSRITLSGTYFTSSQLNYCFGSTWDGVNFSVFGDDGQYNNLYVTSPRSANLVKGTAWVPDSYYGQGNTISKIEGVASGALVESYVLAAGANNTASAVAFINTLNASGALSYTKAVQSASGALNNATGQVIYSGNFRNTFQGNVEGTLPTSFQSGGVPVISDLYEMDAYAASSTLVGYFTFLPSGTLTFTPASFSISQPTITGITSNGAGATVSFNSVSGINYSLLSTTNAITTPLSAWNIVSTNVVTGNGSVKTLVDPAGSSTTTFYTIVAY